MKKRFLILAFLFTTGIGISQNFNVYVTTNVPIDYQLYIDNQLQVFGLNSNYKITGVSPGKKVLRIKTYTNSHQTPSIEIGTSGQKEEFYVIDREGETYVIKKNPMGFQFKNGSNPSIASFRRNMPPPKIDTTKKQVHSCKITDSAVQSILTRLQDLKDPKAKTTYLTKSFHHKCLTTNQIQHMGSLEKTDSDKFELYQKYFRTCVDNGMYSQLIKTFASQEYANKLRDWLELNN